MKVIRVQHSADPTLLRWYPRRSLLDPLAFLDLTTPWEQAWVHRQLATGDLADGTIVELGTWLGAITSAIIRGVDACRGPVPAIHVYDTFVFTDIEGRVEGTPQAGAFADGDCFRPVFEARTASGRARPVVHGGDILAQQWTEGPIGFLFVDLAKNWETWNHIRATWLPDLSTNALVVQQDWAHANTPWLHLWHHRWRDHFETVGQIAHSSSVVFRLSTQLPPDAFAPDRLADYDRSEVRDAFSWAASLVGAELRPSVAGARVMLEALHGDLDIGMEALLEEAAAGPVTLDFATTAIPELARRILEARRAAP